MKLISQIKFRSPAVYYAILLLQVLALYYSIRFYWMGISGDLLFIDALHFSLSFFNLFSFLIGLAALYLLIKKSRAAYYFELVFIITLLLNRRIFVLDLAVICVPIVFMLLLRRDLKDLFGVSEAGNDIRAVFKGFNQHKDADDENTDENIDDEAESASGGDDAPLLETGPKDLKGTVLKHIKVLLFSVITIIAIFAFSLAVCNLNKVFYMNFSKADYARIIDYIDSTYGGQVANIDTSDYKEFGNVYVSLNDGRGGRIECTRGTVVDGIVLEPLEEKYNQAIKEYTYGDYTYFVLIQAPYPDTDKWVANLTYSKSMLKIIPEPVNPFDPAEPPKKAVRISIRCTRLRARF